MASLAVALVADHAFAPVGLHRLQADIRPENRPSQRLVERLGFRQEGLLRRYLDIDGDWRDHLSYALLAEDVPGGLLARWRAARPSLTAAPGTTADDARMRSDGDTPSRRHIGHTTSATHRAPPSSGGTACLTCRRE